MKRSIRLGTLVVLAAMLLLYFAIEVRAAAENSLAKQANTLIVSQNGPYTRLSDALATAKNGDTILVQAGEHPGPVVVDKAIRLVGEGWPIIDGGGKGTVVKISAPGASIENFVVRGSGSEPDRDHAGITLEAANTQALNNRLEDVLFGIFVAAADNALVQGNQVTSKTEYDTGRRGDGIRVWYSQGAQVVDNHVYDARDIVFWYSENTVLRGNLIENSRYGIHLMYCDGALIEGNTFSRNSVGIYVMYTDNIILRENLIRGQHGPNGYALGFKDTDNVTVENNVLVDNHAGAFLDGIPYSPSGTAIFRNNIFAYNDIGVSMLPAVSRVQFRENTFWENVEQMALQGGGSSPNQWEGNFWSDYGGYDLDQNGLGDVAHQSERLFENLTDREPLLRALLYSPAVQAIEFASSSFPIVRPQPKLSDPTPLMQPAELPAWALPEAPRPAWLLSAALLITGLGLLPPTLAFLRRDLLNMKKTKSSPTPTPASGAITNPGSAQIIVNSLSKSYGKFAALTDVSFSIQPGQSVALWGANGAGKTTLLKAILGLVAFSGEIEVGGLGVRRHGKKVRGWIGYVPQEFQYYDLTVNETLRFYAALKKSGQERNASLLQQLGLETHAHKRVGELSGGLRQRLALAVALLSDPPILLLDEPMANLDARARKEYIALLAELRRQGKTLVCATHRTEEVEALCDQVLVLELGKRMALLTPEELIQQSLPKVEISLWVQGSRSQALAYLQQAGFEAHLNGRGTVVVEVLANQKMAPIQILAQHQMIVENFEVEQVAQ